MYIVTEAMKKKGNKTEDIELEIVSDESEKEEEEEEDEDGEEQNSENGSAKPLIKQSKTVKNGKNGKKKRHGAMHPEIRTGKPHAKRCCRPLCCVFLTVKTLMGVLALIIVLANYFTHHDFLFLHFSNSNSVTFKGCQKLEVIPVWQVKFPKMISEGSSRMLLVNDDLVPDVVIGFGTGADGYDIPDYVCDIYFDGQKPCLGGILALDGKTGKEIWRLWTKHEIFALTCQADLDEDGTIDCLAGGRAGVFLAVSIKKGKELWSFGNHAIQSDLMSVYDAQIVEDIDNDGVQDILAMHGGDALSELDQRDHVYGKLILFSGKTGRRLQWMPTPDNKESLYPPQIATGPDGREIIIFGTGSTKHGGALYAKPLLDFYRKNITNIKLIHKDKDFGMMYPAAMADINGDGILDLIVPTSHEQILSFSGVDFSKLWNTTLEGYQSISSVAVGYYDSDTTPDFIVKYNLGDEYPLFKHEKTVVLSGKNGSIISKPIINSISAKSTPITISMDGYGNDLFLHWSINCMDHFSENLTYAFRLESHMYDKSQADLCFALFGTKQNARLMTMRKIDEDGNTVYNSTEWESFEHIGVPNTTKLAEDFLKNSPDFQKNNDDEYSVLPYRKKGWDEYFKNLEEAREREYGVNQPIFDPRTFMLNEDLLNSMGLDSSDVADQGDGQFAGSSEADEPVDVPEKRVFPYPTGEDDQYPQYPVYRDKRSATTDNKSRKEAIIQKYLRRKREADSSYQQGLHKQSATGTLAPSLISSNDTMDIIFPTFWVYPSKIDVLQLDDMKCIEKEVKRFEEKNKQELYESEFEKRMEAIEKKCLKKSKHFAANDRIYETPSEYDPLSINMGQMVVYRFSIRCICDPAQLSYNEKCANFLPYSQQGWSAYMGSNGDSKFKDFR